jgi:hypothetical protein
MKRLFLIATFALLSHTVLAASPTETTLAKSLHESERLVDSLRMDKPSQMRVYAFDGCEYTSAEALWLKAHVHAARRALANNKASDARRELNLIAATLKAHGSTVSV